VPAEEEPTENFAELFAEFESAHKRQKSTDGTQRQLEGTVISINPEFVFIDIGYKIEGSIPRTDFVQNADAVKPGDKFPVSIKGRTEDGYYALTRFKVAQPTDWTALEAAFNAKTPVSGTVTAVVKGGLTVDVGVRAFMPASRTGTRDAAEMEKLVGTEITCRITKLDTSDEDVVVDRRSVLEEQSLLRAEGRRAALTVGDTVHGTVRSLTSFGAFIDLDGIDGLLHIGDISWARVNAASDVLTVGQELDVKILKIDAESHRLSLGLKQLQPEPWETVPERYSVGQRVAGTVTRLADFGAFVEIEPGVEGLIHVSELSWTKRVKKPSDLLKVGDPVDAVILGIKPEERRLSLGLKQALANPWSELGARYPIGSQVAGPVVRLAPFGAFVQVEEGIEGLVHVSEIVPDKRIQHPQDALKVGEIVKAMVLAIDTEKRQIKLSIKQLIPTSVDEFFNEHKVGDEFSGRVLSEKAAELGEGVIAQIRAKAVEVPAQSAVAEAKPDLSSLTSMLQSRWKGQDKSAGKGDESLRAGQVRTFKIVTLDAAAKKIEVEVV
jgi:small subunit ribosomal protein S1